ncbi:FAD/NAD(P)-dependent oxidoreductase [Dongia sedimenti]|uniref:FAD-dependent oxidoreductase n=1 Tax=Dongia sedimenti TaxID=3064282 RepID=A0ABU0YVB5_9PROT|nr:FAD-dependent oxidoreductase [Rhodospirillaceae bacterium R-7]
MTALDLLIVGGGAAGLSAAGVARAMDVSVELLDERPALGGNFFAGIGERTDGVGAFGPDYARGRALLNAAGAAKLSTATLAWRLERDGRAFALGEEGPVRSIAPKRLLIATGAMERPIPIPGAILPGVMYAGAAQLMLKTANVAPSGRCVLVGSGPLLLLLAKQLLDFGVVPSALVETTPRAGFAAVLQGLPAALNSPDLLRKGLALQRAIKRARVPWHRHVTGVSLKGGERVEQVVFTDAKGRNQSIQADLVLLHDGIIPNDHVTRQLGCKESWNAAQHCFSPVIDQWGETSLPGIFAAGDCTGIWGAQAAELSGKIAAIEIGRQLGCIDQQERDRKAREPLLKLKRQRAFRPFLEARFPPSLARAEQAAADTVICRCENVTAGEIRSAVAQGATGPDQLKSFTRSGMGPCQGRSCAMALAEIMARELACGVQAVGRHDIRPPLKPLPLGKIGAAQVALETVP